ncbi:MAG TPA: class I SAM-dependent methyltransferase, partial [Tepidisphaeraceae bacterium]|nr:class I SAM-dependent methyltransferase [Tepidisphaeraceae bacterium]
SSPAGAVRAQAAGAYHPRRMIDLSNQPCPVCRTTGRSQPLHTTSYPEHHYPGPFTLRRCDECGLLFNSPRLDPTGLARLYGRNYYFFLRSDAREFDRIVGMYQRSVALIDADFPHAGLPRHSIDIGCGRGYLPAVLRELGWDAWGIEISPDAAEYARSRFGLDVFTGTVEQYATSAQARQFALVTAIDVIEHVPDPDGFVAAAAKLVAPGGWLIIDTPNAAAENIRFCGVAWKGFNPFHIYLFTIPNLITLLRRHGMHAERCFSYGNTPSGPRLRERVAARLKAAGLLGPLAGAYFAARRLMIRGNDTARQHLARAVARIRCQPPYSASSDSTAPLAASRTGDNIVVIARKQAEPPSDSDHRR